MSIHLYSKEIIVRDLNQLKIEIEQTPSEVLWETEPGIINSVGTLCYHICGNLNHFIGCKIGNNDYKRDRIAEFERKDLSKDELIHLIEDTIKVINSVLSSVDDTILNEKMIDPPSQHEGKTIGFFLIQLCCHLSRHRGQLDYLRRIKIRKND